MLTGKGFYIWQIKNCAPDAATLVARAQQAGLRHVLIKIADGAGDYPIQDASAERLTAESIAALKAANISVAGWTFIYGGNDPKPETQAQRFAQRLQQFGLDFGVINAEKFQNKRWTAAQARAFITTLKTELQNRGMGNTLLALSANRFPSTQPDYPFAEFMAGCAFAMPQMYWSSIDGGDPLATLQQSMTEYGRLFPDKAIIPTGATYWETLTVQGRNFDWQATPNQVNMFLNQAAAMNVPAVNFWSWQHAWERRPLWDAVSAYPFGQNVQTVTATVQATPVSNQAAGTPNAVVGLPDTTDDDGIAIIGVGDAGFQQGIYEGKNAELVSFERNGTRFTYVLGNLQGSTAYAQWLPRITISGEYLIEAFIPGVNATTSRARYHIHGVVGQDATTVVELNQYDYEDEYVRLGIFQLDGGHQFSGMVSLNNYLKNETRDTPKVAFGPLRWRKVERAGGILPGHADGFDAPVGTPDERRTDKIWPGPWYDANPFLTYYTLGYHTGVDLNLPRDADKGAPCYAIADGEVTYAGEIFNRNGTRSGFGNAIVVRHDPYVTVDGRTVVAYSRYGHIKDIIVTKGQRVRRGDRVATVWNIGTQAHHLHFDISLTNILQSDPNHWPGSRRDLVERHYVDPLTFIRDNRPRF